MEEKIDKRGYRFYHSTGHGVGLEIHELPNISPKSETVLGEGMVFTIEPGVYKENRHGIRHENTVFVRRSMEGEFGEFYELETITYFPIDTRAILVEELTRAQREWLNDYHVKTYEKLSPMLQGSDLEWLKERTKAV